jgi:hypothetical protein
MVMVYGVGYKKTEQATQARLWDTVIEGFSKQTDTQELGALLARDYYNELRLSNPKTVEWVVREIKDTLRAKQISNDLRVATYTCFLKEYVERLGELEWRTDCDESGGLVVLDREFFDHSTIQIINSWCNNVLDFQDCARPPISRSAQWTPPFKSFGLFLWMFAERMKTRHLK